MYTFGLVSGVGLREHNVLTMDDFKVLAAKITATAKSLAKPANPKNEYN